LTTFLPPCLLKIKWGGRFWFLWNSFKQFLRFMKHIYTLLAVAVMTVTPAVGQTYLECDFDDGMPSDFTLIDNDGLSPSSSMAKIGFKPGTAWITETPKNGDSPAACSTSWYTPAGQADDWMITPAFTVTGDNSVLRWRAMASDKGHRDGYAVYISTSAGTAIADFDTSAPLFAVDEEEAVWTVHSVSLDAYKGQTVTVAFVNNSVDKSRLYVDDIFAGVYSAVMLRLNLDRKVPVMSGIAVSGTAYTYSPEPVKGFTVGFEYGGETFTQQFDKTITADAPVNFTLDMPMTLDFYTETPYTVWIESGKDRYAVESTVTSYPRRVVCEEGTGTWCGWCVRGIVMLDSIKHHYADRIIGIAAHSSDPMANDYVSAIGRWLGSGGLPCGTVNRKVGVDPRDFIATAERLFDEESVLVAMKAETTTDEAMETVTAKTSLWFGADHTGVDYRLGYAIIENNVHQPDDSDYSQCNYYSGGGSGPMGGYENKPKYVPADEMWYNDVARGYVDDIYGVEGSVPSEIRADEEIMFTKTFTLPDGIIDHDNTALVVMLIDQSDGHIVNSVLTPIGKNFSTGVKGVDAQHVDNLRRTEYYTPDGRRLNSPQRGLNIVRTADGKTVKVMVN
jgi:hypothetical protein